jgi:hypothetical protein
MTKYIPDPEIYKRWENIKENSYPIPDPNDVLIEIYEVDTFKQCLHIRAEKWYSPEWSVELANLTATSTTTNSATTNSTTTTNGEPNKKIPLNVINPNYAELLDHLKKIRKTYGEIKGLIKSIKSSKEPVATTTITAATTAAAAAATEEAQKKKDENMVKLNKMLQKDLPAFIAKFSATPLIIYLFDKLPDIRFLRYLLSLTECVINHEMVSLIYSYFLTKYLSFN